MREIEIINSGTEPFPFFQIMKQGVEYCSTNTIEKANEIVKLLESPTTPSVVGRELLIDFAQQYYSDEETCIHNVDLYISQHPVRKVSDEEIEKWAHEKYSLNNNCKTIGDFDFNSIIAFQYEGAVNAAKAMRDGKIPISQPNNE